MRLPTIALLNIYPIHANMVTPTPAEDRKTLAELLRDAGIAILAALAIGACLWLPTAAIFALTGRAFLLTIILANQASFLATGLWWNRAGSAHVGRGWSILIGVGVALACAFGGVTYDVALRLMFGASAPTIGPWGILRDLPPAGAGILFPLGTIAGPIIDECFFRAGVFGHFARAGRPVVGAAASSVLFACSRLDFTNLPAYVILGLALCWTYHRTGSLVAPIVAHAFLNAAMLLLLFSGYQ